MRKRVLASAILVLAIGAVSQAEEKPLDRPLDRTDLDRRIVKIVYEAALQGTDLWNKKGDQEGCFRLYQGTVQAVLPMLDHRPKLALSVKERLEKGRLMSAGKGAHVLREALDEIQQTIAPGAKSDTKIEPKTTPTPEPKTATLWDRLGGEAGVKKLVDSVFAAAIEDKNVNLLRDGKFKLDVKGVAHFKQMLVDFVSEATGGPLKYKGKDMKTAHAGMKITAEEFDALAEHIKKSLERAKIAPADINEFMKIVGATKKDIVEGKGM